MKIAIISSTFPGDRAGGAPTFVAGRSRYLSRKCDVRVFALGSNNIAEKNYSVGKIGRFYKIAFFTWFRVMFLLIKWRPDIVEIHNIPVALPLFLFWPRVTYFFHGPARLEAEIEGASKLRTQITYRLEKFCIWRAKKILTASYCFKNIAMAEHPTIIKNNIPILVRYPKIKVNMDELKLRDEATVNDAPTFICIRRLVARTGVMMLVEAFILALEENRLDPRAKLFIGGIGPLQQDIKNKIQNSNFASNISLLGHISDEDRDNLYTAADFNILPTLGLEGFGLVILEAAFRGCPSIVTKVHALPEVINLLENRGILIEPNVIDLANALSNAKIFSFEQRAELSQFCIRKFAVKI